MCIPFLPLCMSILCTCVGCVLPHYIFSWLFNSMALLIISGWRVYLCVSVWLWVVVARMKGGCEFVCKQGTYLCQPRRGRWCDGMEDAAPVPGSIQNSSLGKRNFRAVIVWTEHTPKQARQTRRSAILNNNKAHERTSPSPAHNTICPSSSSSDGEADKRDERHWNSLGRHQLSPVTSRRGKKLLIETHHKLSPFSP